MNRAGAAGWSLTELMVATALMGVLVSGGLAAYLRASAAYRDASAEQRLLERAQYAFATLGSDVSMAGYFGAGPPPQRLAAGAVPASVASCGNDLVARLDRFVEAAGGYELTCPAAGGGAAADSHTLVVRRLAAQPAAPRAGRAQWLSWMLPPWHGALVWDGVLPAGTTLDPPRVELRDLVLRHYYVSRQSDGDTTTPALRVKTLTEIAGRPGFLDTEVMHGIETMQVALLPIASAPRAVRITLQLRDNESPAGTRAARRLSVSRVFAIRNAPLPH